ncbi:MULTISPECIES: DUF6443 domain-containing protein [unclassified Chitinophaga]|uniref:DUF6443 domain-containing protein n=1 Tax=unclassified Chitinophaga TaxID=2619133 RepID=UPI0030100B8E
MRNSYFLYIFRTYTAVIVCLLAGNTVDAQNRPQATAQTVVTPVARPVAYKNTRTNYVRSWEPSMPANDTAFVAATSRTVAEVKENTQYMDGLGRPIQNVTRQITPSGKDYVKPFVYDDFGRAQYNYLPYAATGNNGKFKMDPFQEQASFMSNQYSSQHIFYGETKFEPSPLNRVSKALAAGDSWTGTDRGIKVNYQFNTISDAIQIWEIREGDLKPWSTGVFASGELQKNISTDENGIRTIEYKNKKSQTILKKVELSPNSAEGYANWLCTYFIYDDLDMLRYVLSPKAISLIYQNWNTNLTTAIIRELCTVYRYDGRRRMIMKQVPGADSVEMVYDIRDRLVFTRNGNLRSKSPAQWQVSLYDGLDRPVMTALYNSSLSRESLQMAMNTALNNSKTITYNVPYINDLVVASHDNRLKYEAKNSIVFNPGFESSVGNEFETELNPAGISHSINLIVSNPLPDLQDANLYPLTYTFYDDYSYPGVHTAVTNDLALTDKGSNVYEELVTNPGNMTKGMVTGMKIRVLGTNEWLTTTNFYNYKGRVIQTVADNAVGGKDVTSLLYDFNGKLLSTFLRHSAPRSILTKETIILTTTNYDVAGRVISTKKRLNGEASLDRTLHINTYDESGQLKTKRLGIIGTGQLETLTYEYNIRGWVRGINRKYVNAANNPDNNWFGMEMNYDSGFVVNQFNGNLAGVRWKSKSNDIARAYGFTYDATNRLLSADYSQQNAPNTPASAWQIDKADFSVSGLTYDPNGNITHMNQKGMDGLNVVNMDNLSYTYRPNSNKIAAVADASQLVTNLGDFKNDAIGGDDYDYDGNGNLKYDNNRNINSITYNHLNLPENITVRNKGSILYLYDALGNRLRKTVIDNSTASPRTIVTDYATGFVYQNDTLQLLAHEEGRVRVFHKTGDPPAFKYDYYMKDYLGNIRMVLTEQSDLTIYTATMETSSAAKENALFGNVDNTRSVKPIGYPSDEVVAKNEFVAKLNAAGNGKKIGPNIVLRVTVGDTVQLSTRAFYKTSVPSHDKQPIGPENIISSLLQAFNGNNSTGGGHGNGTLNRRTPFNDQFTTNDYQKIQRKDPDQQMENKPKAYLNYLLFDDQFQLVDENSGVKQVKGEPDQLQTLEKDKMVMQKSGFLYVYTSNESAQDVYFDNITLGVMSGPLLEETHYYPFGLTMAGISSNLLKGTNYPENRLKYGGKELQTKEFADGSGLELYDFNARMQDPQIGRFQQIDPKGELFVNATPYNYCFSNPVLFIDPDGMLAEYNWEDGKYYDGGEEVSWDNVQKQYRTGNYAGIQSVMLAPQYTDDKKQTIVNDYGSGALKIVVDAAINTKGNIRVMHVEDSRDAAEQMESIEGKINNLFILSHGDAANAPHRAYFAIGVENFHTEDISKSSGLAGIAKKMASTKGPLPSAAQVIVLACGAGGTHNGGTELMMALAKKLHATVFGNQSLTHASMGMFSGSTLSYSRNNWPSNHDPNGKYSNGYLNTGNWTKAYERGGNAVYETVQNVYIDAFGKIHSN